MPRITCSWCQSSWNIKDEYIGRSVKCPKCWNIIKVEAVWWGIVQTFDTIKNPVNPETAEEENFWESWIKWRIGRRVFFGAFCKVFFMVMALTILKSLFGKWSFWLLVTFIDTVASILLLILFVFNTIKRLHDLNISWWYSLIMFVPLLDIILFVYLLIFRWTTWNNKYGSDTLRSMY
jgi:uncharacterized membrane protein YhaH (DUF805 family)